MKVRLPTVVMLAVAATVLAAGSASGAASGGKLVCFADSPATCTLNSATSATIDATGGGDAGVYLSNGKSLQGKALANASFSFTYFCANTIDITSCTGGGVPRWSIPISTNGNPKTTAAYAFLDGQNCMNGGTQLSGGALTVSTTESTCPVFFQNVEYSTWAAFAAANPTYTIAAALPFVISDVTTAQPQIVTNVIETKS
jgi:hypothetical protein